MRATASAPEYGYDDLAGIDVRGKIALVLLTAPLSGRADFRGRDPKLAVEHVVYSAHLDHLGIGEPVDGDAIYNGALDNASGVACLLEIARPSRRSQRARRGRSSSWS